MRADTYSRTVMVIGGGATAGELARRLVDAAVPVIVAAPDEEGARPQLAGVEWICGRVRGVTGQVGGFDVRLVAGGEETERRAGMLVLALATEHRPIEIPGFAVLGGSIRPLSEVLKEAGEGTLPPALKRFVFLDRLDGFSTVASSERLLRCALNIQSGPGAAVTILTSQLKVASPGLESLYGRLREAGALVLKTGEVQPEVGPQGVTIHYADPILEEEVSLDADLLVVAEDERPSQEFEAVAGVLRLERDQQGFLQADNVLRKPCLTNRRGVLVAGSSAGAATEWDTAQSVASVLSELHELDRWLNEAEHPETILYNRDYCAFCLTCFRVCPHVAIHFTDRPHFLTLACQSCGLCASACPGEALELVGHEKDTFFKRLGGLSPIGAPGAKRIVAVACSKSAARVLASLPADAPERKELEWVEVPCAGTVRATSLLRLLAMRDMVDGVLLLACHEGNCRSGTGTIYGRRLVEGIQGLLRAVGADAARIAFISTAANDERVLAEAMDAFRKGLPSRG